MTSLEKFRCYLVEQEKMQHKKAQALSGNDRQDEAIMAKITGNMYKILIEISAMAEKRHTGAEFAYITNFMENQLRTPWQKSLTTAELHGDHVKAAHENIKLSTLAEIEKVLISICKVGEGA